MKRLTWLFWMLTLTALGDPSRVNSLVEQLGSESFAKRQQAFRILKELLSSPQRSEIHRALHTAREIPDAEVRHRIRELLKSHLIHYPTAYLHTELLNDDIGHVELSQTGDLVAAAASGGRVRIWQTSDRKVVFDEDFHQKLDGLIFDPRSQVFWIAPRWNKHIGITRNILDDTWSHFPLERKNLFPQSFTKRGDKFVSYEAPHVVLIDTQSGDVISQILPGNCHETTRYDSLDSNLIMYGYCVGTGTQSLRWSESQKTHQLHQLDLPSSPTGAFEYSPERQVFAVNKNNELLLYHLESGERVQLDSWGPRHSFSFALNGALLLTGGLNSLFVYDTLQGQRLLEVQVPGAQFGQYFPVWGPRFSPHWDQIFFAVDQSIAFLDVNGFFMKEWDPEFSAASWQNLGQDARQDFLWLLEHREVDLMTLRNIEDSLPLWRTLTQAPGKVFVDDPEIRKIHRSISLLSHWLGQAKKARELLGKISELKIPSASRTARVVLQ